MSLTLLPDPAQSLTDDEAGRITLALLATGPRSQEDLALAIQWAIATRVASDLLELVLTGHLHLDLNPAREITFRPAPASASAPSSSPLKTEN